VVGQQVEHCRSVCKPLGVGLASAGDVGSQGLQAWR
jgi:hypothetical protein